MLHRDINAVRTVCDPHDPPTCVIQTGHDIKKGQYQSKGSRPESDLAKIFSIRRGGGKNRS